MGFWRIPAFAKVAGHLLIAKVEFLDRKYSADTRSISPALADVVFA